MQILTCFNIYIGIFLKLEHKDVIYAESSKEKCFTDDKLNESDNVEIVFTWKKKKS